MKNLRDYAIIILDINHLKLTKKQVINVVSNCIRFCYNKKQFFLLAKKQLDFESANKRTFFRLALTSFLTVNGHFKTTSTTFTYLLHLTGQHQHTCNIQKNGMKYLQLQFFTLAGNHFTVVNKQKTVIITLLFY